ncbi:MAG: DNA polymerase/3'-5' exonuclease PolX [Methanomicrobiales archaeon]|nr:DNA polymerase/3'-5' exonuclease PolX [Methanomicrobiales archaeon]
MDETNHRVAELLHFMGQILEIRGEDAFKIRAYHRAAEEVSRLNRSLRGMSIEEIRAVSGVGEKIAHKIQEILATGTFLELEEMRTGIPPTLLEILNLEGMGPKTVARLWRTMGIESLDDLEKAARGHRIRAIKGFGEKKEEDILKAVQLYRQQGSRMNRLQADRVVACVTAVLPAGSYDVAGSFRRGKSTVGDIDIVTTLPSSIVNPRLRGVGEEMIDGGEKRTSIRCQGQRVDIRFTRPEEYGSMLLYLTGSKDFNIRLREIALSRGLKLNEYGIEDKKEGKMHTFSREEDIFSFLGLDNIPPELREDQGEIPAAFRHQLPNLIGQSDLLGDLHTHSSWSDGRMSLSELARAGETQGYHYLLISDHSATLGITRGLTEERLRKQMQEIEQINRTSPCQLLSGIEVDITGDGGLGLASSVLGDLDLVIASIHSGFKQERDVITRRMITAVANDYVDIIGHPTGRLLGERQPYDLDVVRVIEAAVDTGTALEINASPHRLDLDDPQVREAKRHGVKLSLGTDAHEARELSCMRYGIMVARRGWCEPADLLNTLPGDEIRK